MTLPIRARLTVWYSTVVVLVLATGALVGGVVQSRLALARLDADLARTMATLEGVMRTELTEGLTLEAAAQAASAEVVVPDRTLALSRPDGVLLAVWGWPIDRRALVSPPDAAALATITTPAGDVRQLRRSVEHAGHRYHAWVLGSLAELNAEHTAWVQATIVGVLIALLAAAVGGWVIGRQTLRPLTEMAAQASRIDVRNPTERLAAQDPDDELGLLAQAFNGLLDRVSLALNQQRQFVADASHELRTPVSVVRTAAQVTMSRATRSEGEYRECLLIVAEQATRLTRLVDAMFLLSRADAHGVPLRSEFLNLDDLVADNARALRVIADQRQIRLTTGGDQEVGLIGDDTLLRQLVGNLMDNAVRHARVGGTVSSVVRRTGAAVTFAVTNDGQVIAADDHERIFERFARAGVSEGAGLGLRIARWIAEAHGGTLALERSEPGRTTFIVTLPTDRAVPPATVPAA